MKIIIWSIIILFVFIGYAQAEHNSISFNLKYYGSFKKMVQTKNIEGVVELKNALPTPHTYAVGVIKNAEGEITVFDDEILLNYGKDGINRTISQIPAAEQAMILVTAQVEKWTEIIIPSEMSAIELYAFILEQAKKLGLNIKKPFPFLLSGYVKNLVWSVNDGIDIKLSRQSKHLFLRKLVGLSEYAPVIFVGFYSGEIHGEFTHQGQSWHVHVLFKNDKVTGHVNTFSVGKDAKLKIPVK